MTEQKTFDVCIVGGGLIGLAVGVALVAKRPGVSLLLVEKETDVATHQSGHNSGVVHSGLYYKPGSLKAKLCVEGRSAIYDSEIPVVNSGKLVVATSEAQIPALDELERRGHANGLADIQRVDPEGIREHEPAVTGISALYVPEAGVADYTALARKHVSVLKKADAVVLKGEPATRIRHLSNGVEVMVGAQAFRATALVNCAGLQSDHVAQLAGIEPEVRIVPFRGEYYRLSNESEGLVRTLVYPVPDPRFPFLGVHFTRRIDGAVEVGPNAVLAFGREHYRGDSADWAELRSILRYPGFRKLAARHWWPGASELVNSRSRRLYARLARKLIPDLQASHLAVGGSGVRAQAVDRNGNLVDDFVIEQAGNTVHVLNAPSPGATASIAIGRYISDKVTPIL